MPKYFKRIGTPGNYKYFYTKEDYDKFNKKGKSSFNQSKIKNENDLEKQYNQIKEEAKKIVNDIYSNKNNKSPNEIKLAKQKLNEYTKQVEKIRKIAEQTKIPVFKNKKFDIKVGNKNYKISASVDDLHYAYRFSIKTGGIGENFEISKQGMKNKKINDVIESHGKQLIKQNIAQEYAINLVGLPAGD